MLRKNSPKCTISQDKSPIAVTGIQRQLSQQYGLSYHHAALIAEMQGYRSSEVY